MGRGLAGAALCAALLVVPPVADRAEAAPVEAPVHDVRVDGPPSITWSGDGAVASARYREIETPATGVPADGALAPLVVGGNPVAIDDHRYAAKVFVMDGPFSAGECVAVVVHPEWLLTAAHCTEVERTAGWYVPVEELAIVVGTADWTTYVDDVDAHLRFTSDIRVHPEWDRSTLSNDLALVRVEPALDMTVVDTVPLFDLGEFDAGDPAFVVGWGATETGGPAVERISGATAFVDPSCGLWPAVFGSWDDEPHLCASAIDAGFCQGDSGGPLVVDRNGVVMVAGVVSFNSSLGCAADPAYPDVYSRVSHYTPWVESITGPLWLDAPVDPTTATATLPDARPGRAYAVQLFDADGVALYDGRLEMPGAMILGPGETGVDCAQALAHPFVDVDPASFAAGPVGCLWHLGVTTGTSADTFSPDATVTREQIAAFAARFYETVVGKSCDGAHPFHDVPESSFAASAIGCVATLGVTTGTTPSTYSPYETVTREQMAAYIGRLYRAISGAPCGAPAPFVDVNPSSYAAADIGCLHELGITTGVSDGWFAPEAELTRAQLATFFARLYLVLGG